MLKIEKIAWVQNKVFFPESIPELIMALVYTVGANKKFTFHFHSTVILRCEPFRSVFTESSVFCVSTIADSAIIGSARNG